LWVLSYNIDELKAATSFLGIPKPTIRKVPTFSAWLVATIEMACLGWIFLAIGRLVCTSILEDNQSPSGARIAIAIDSVSFGLGTNNGSRTWLGFTNHPREEQ
jgi:hypothetical protein